MSNTPPSTDEPVSEPVRMACFEEANAEQKEAILTTEGPLLIIAGPGTGKTYTLIQRIVNLVVNHHVDPSRILVTTFTVKASKEMLRRLLEELGKYGVTVDTEEMFIGDFHSICNRILTENIQYTTLRKNFKVKDEKEQGYFISRHYSDFKTIPGFDMYIRTEKGYIQDSAAIMSCVNRLQEEMIDADQLIASEDVRTSCYGKILKKYLELRSASNFLDYTSMQTETYRLLTENRGVADPILDSIDYVFIDEYQDTNHIQEKLTFLLGSRKRNICVVGDEDQSIYRFRGATVRNILEFKDRFRDCHTVTLTRNYRSEPDIISLYNRWMCCTAQKGCEFSWENCRYEKTIVPAGRIHPGRRHVFRCTGSHQEEYHTNILNIINDLVRNGSVTDYNQIVFLFGTVSSRAVLELADHLREHGIPVYSPRSRVFFKRSETRLALGALLSMLQARRLLKNIANGRNREALEDTLREFDDYAVSGEGRALASWVAENGSVFSDDGLDTERTFSRILMEMLRFEPFNGIVERAVGSSLIEQRPAHNLSRLITLVRQFEVEHNLGRLTATTLPKVLEDFVNRYLQYLLTAGVEEYEDEEVFAPSGHVSFFTIHQAKGLEFPVVFVGLDTGGPWADDASVPHSIIDAYSGRRPFENPLYITKYNFWRKFYVAFSRAQSMMFLLDDPSGKHPETRYFGDIWDSLQEYCPGKAHELRPVADAVNLNSYSFTGQINRFSVCPLQYCLYNEIGFSQLPTVYTVFGTLVHGILEDMNKAVLEEGPSAVDEDRIRSWAEENFRTLLSSSAVRITGRDLPHAIDQCLGYYRWMEGRWDSLYASEIPISVVHTDHIVNGKADLVLKNGEEYEIVDYKTETKPDSEDDYHYQRVKKQLEIYAYLFEEKYGLRVGRMTAYYTSFAGEDRTIVFEKTDRSNKDTERYLETMISGIREGDFTRRCDDPSICRGCDFRHYCGKGPE